MSMFTNNALLGGGDRVMVWIREQRKIIRHYLMANLDINPGSNQMLAVIKFDTHIIKVFIFSVSLCIGKHTICYGNNYV